MKIVDITKMALLLVFVVMMPACSHIKQPIQESDFSVQFGEMTVSDSVRTSAAKVDTNQFICSRAAKQMNLDDVALVDLSLIEGDIREALLELSMITGVSIVVDDSVDGVVSVNLEKQSLTSSLSAIVAPGNYSYKVMQDFIFIGSGDPDSSSYHLLSSTCSYRPRYMKPDNMVSLLQPYYRKFVTSSDEHGTITIVAPVNIQKRIQDDLITLDHQPKQVLLEMSIVEISTAALATLGVDWSRLKSLSGRLSNSNLQITDSSKDGVLSVNKTIKLMSSPFIQALNFLEGNGQAKVKATPRIVTLDGHIAEFSSLENTWVNLGGSSGSRADEIVYGVMLKLVPRISENNSVSLNILKASVSDLVSREGESPRVVSHSVTNHVRVADGETLVLGGLLQKSRRHQREQIPVLGDIPLLGWLFKSEREQVNESEVVIIITPHVIEGVNS